MAAEDLSSSSKNLMAAQVQHHVLLVHHLPHLPDLWYPHINHVLSALIARLICLTSGPVIPSHWLRSPTDLELIITLIGHFRHHFRLPSHYHSLCYSRPGIDEYLLPDRTPTFFCYPNPTRIILKNSEFRVFPSRLFPSRPLQTFSIILKFCCFLVVLTRNPLFLN